MIANKRHLGALLAWVAAGFGASAMLGCRAGSSPAAAPPPVINRGEIVADAAVAMAAHESQGALELPAASMPAAPWLAPLGGGASEQSFHNDAIEPALASADLVIAKTSVGYIALPKGEGALGPLRPPSETVWLGRDGEGRLLSATKSGELYRAADVSSARDASKFDKIAMIAGATAWDARSSFVAAAAGPDVFVSADFGRSFRRRRVAKALVIEKIFVRSDGAVAVHGDIPGDPDGSSVWAAPLGAPFERGEVDRDDLERMGEWIGSPGDCGLVLSSDGRRFVVKARWPGDGDRTAWLRSFRRTSSLDPFASDGTDSIVEGVPPPPPPPPEAGRRLGGCHRSKPPRIHIGITTVTGMHCAGAAYFGGSMELPPREAAFEIALLSDGRCAKNDADPKAFDADQCKLGAPLTRAPSVVRHDRTSGSASIGAVPPGCRPERLLSVGGAGLLLCADGEDRRRTSVYMTDGPSGAWLAEGELPIQTNLVSGVAMAPDGTLLLRVAWGDAWERKVFVRSPLALGSASAWRAVDVTGAIEVRVDVGGALLVFGTRATTPVPAWLSIDYDTPGAARVRLAASARTNGSVVDASIEGRRVVLWQHESALSGDCDARSEAPRGGRISPWVLTKSGSLRPATPEEARAVN